MTLWLTDSDSDANDEDEEEDAPHPWTVDLEHYKDEDAIPETQNPLTWWKLNTHRFPVLAFFAKAVLCVPETSVPCANVYLAHLATLSTKHVLLFYRKMSPH